MRKCVSDEIVADLKKQVKESSGMSWDDFLEENFFHINCGEFFEPHDAAEFIVDGLIIVPICPMDFVEVLATINLEMVRNIEIKQAEVNVYRKVDANKPAYFLYTNEDNVILFMN